MSLSKEEKKNISKIIFFGFLTTSKFNIWPSFWLIFFAVIASVIGTTLGKIILDKINNHLNYSKNHKQELTPKHKAKIIAYSQ